MLVRDVVREVRQLKLLSSNFQTFLMILHIFGARPRLMIYGVDEYTNYFPDGEVWRSAA